MARYLDLIKPSNPIFEEVRTATSSNEIDERNETNRLGCERCSRPLLLPETRMIGRCVRCLTEAEWIDTLARMALRRERTKRAVADRKSQLRMDGVV